MCHVVKKGLLKTVLEYSNANVFKSSSLINNKYCLREIPKYILY